MNTRHEPARVHTPINTFLQTEELQTLLPDRITNICTPKLTRIETELPLNLRELRLLKLFLEEVEQTPVRRNTLAVSIAILKSLANSHPYKLRNPDGSVIRDELTIRCDGDILAFGVMGEGLCGLGNGHNGVVARAMDPIGAAIST